MPARRCVALVGRRRCQRRQRRSPAACHKQRLCYIRRPVTRHAAALQARHSLSANGCNVNAAQRQRFNVFLLTCIVVTLSIYQALGECLVILKSKRSSVFLSSSFRPHAVNYLPLRPQPMPAKPPFSPGRPSRLRQRARPPPPLHRVVGGTLEGHGAGPQRCACLSLYLRTDLLPPARQQQSKSCFKPRHFPSLFIISPARALAADRFEFLEIMSHAV